MRAGQLHCVWSAPFGGRFACELRIDFLVECDAEALVLNPGNAAADRADIPQVDLDAVAALNLGGAFAHHSAIRKIADPYSMLFAILLDSDIGEQKQAVARHAPGFDTRHIRLFSSTLITAEWEISNQRRTLSACSDQPTAISRWIGDMGAQ